MLFSFGVRNRSVFYDLHRKTKKFDIYVVRNNENNDTFQDSKPCIECQKNLKRMGFKNIYYSLDDGKFEKKKVKELNINHLSRAQRNIKINGKKYLKI